MPRKRDESLYETRTCAAASCHTTFRVRKKDDKRFCSKACSNTDPRLIEMKNASTRDTVNTRYGGTHYSRNPETQRRLGDTMEVKYGVRHALQSPELFERSRATKLARYGDANYNNPAGRADTKLRRYGSTGYNNFRRRRESVYTKVSSWSHVRPMFGMDELKDIGVYATYDFECVSCGGRVTASLANGYVPHCRHCTAGEPGVGEAEIAEYVRSLNAGNVVLNDQSVLPGALEIDILLPAHMLAIEYNGLHWHSELSGKGHSYHLNKTRGCGVKGYRLIHVFEHQWVTKRSIVETMIRSAVGVNSKVGARSCTVREIDFKTKSEFLIRYHLQGDCRSSVNLGLFRGEELLCVMCFMRSRYDKAYDQEMVRFASGELTVVGGFSKMLAYFVRKYSPKTVLAYADRAHSVGNVYRVNGFKLVGVTKPGFHYFKGMSVFSREAFQKHKLRDKLATFDPSLTAWENMRRNGWDRYWDCGNYKFLLTVTPKNEKPLG